MRMAGRADTSQKRAMPNSISAATRAAQRAATVGGSEEGEELVADWAGAGTVPVGSTRKAKSPAVTCPSVADVTR